MRSFEGEALERKVHPLIKVFVLVHMALIFSWCLPRPAPAVANGKLSPSVSNIGAHPVEFALLANQSFKQHSPTSAYLLSTGLWQYWDMFAPNPANLDYWIDTVVTLADGTTVVVPYPRMSSLSIPEKYLKERYRKYAERLTGYRLPTFAVFMARKAYTDPGNPPVRAIVRRHQRTLRFPHVPKKDDYEIVVLIDHVVDPRSLTKV